MDEENIEDNIKDFEEAPEEEKGEEPDQYWLNAQRDIRELYERDKESIFYIRQLQVKFEKRYFHWVTHNALKGLLNMGYLKEERMLMGEGTSAHYFFRKSNRYPKRKIKEMNKVLEKYSSEVITRGCGCRAEDLFCNALALRGFMPKAKRVREYRGIKWEETGHDMDFVFEKDGKEYGCEIKNTLGYIRKEELLIKLGMCEKLNLIPLFIMRHSPKTYNKMIIDQGGFALIFESQIYELSQKALVGEIREKLGLPVDCPRAIPSGILDRFEKWHNKNR
jgi:hypothetical protein